MPAASHRAARANGNYNDVLEYELTGGGQLFTATEPGKKYPDGSSIDWLQEEAAERQRNHELHSQAGVRGALLPALDSVRMWIVAFVYISLAVAFGGTSAFLVETYAPYAFHTGIPEIKAILGGYVFDAFLSPWTLLIKALGLALSVASGLSLGKEGPLVHVACCMAYLFSRMFEQFRHNEAAAAAAGVSVAFGSPLGGVLFGLEELDAFASETDVMWRGFVASAIAAVALQWVNPFGTAKLVLFQVTALSDQWRAFELIPWISLGVIGGVLGSFLIRLNVEIAIYRRQSIVGDWPILEVVCASAITAAFSYLVVFGRYGPFVPLHATPSLIVCCVEEFNLRNWLRTFFKNVTLKLTIMAYAKNVFLLVLTAMMKIVLTAWTFGMMVSSRVFHIS
ncbi:hypothetical protein EST38_g8077 [Candolleomyces aberdarensis]|uniref:Uncharacterized protein n=1 Tax=Candolleomyces aberdarensis TaxID=2316362 RepID=A0A4Q2DFA5_9AGAR|nr:hypothetical protein EST38_g8077 [Candolleomyces aberdarensis]